MRSLTSGTLAALATMASCSLFYSAQPASFDRSESPFHGADEVFDPSRKLIDPPRDLDQVGSSTRIQVVIQNSRPEPVYTYVTGVNTSSGDYMILQNASNGNFNWAVKPSGNESNNANAYYFTEYDSSYEIKAQANYNTSFYIPSYAAAGRIYIAEGALRFGTNEGGPMAGFVAPSVSNAGLPEHAIVWQFVEYTWERNDFWINLSNVDLVSIPIGLTVTSQDSGRATEVPGLVSNATALICEALTRQTIEDEYNWKQLCIWNEDQKLIRVLSPDQYLSINVTDPLNHYWDKYVDDVWQHYQTTNLTINTQDSRPESTNNSAFDKGNKSAVGEHVSCLVSNDTRLHCYNPDSGKSYVFLKPTTKEIFGCTQDSNTFQVSQSDKSDWVQSEIVPRLCAAFHRSTLLREGGNTQPYHNGANTADYYYCQNNASDVSCPGNTTNHYARVVHKYEQDGMGYAFAYDDTNPIADGLSNASANAGGVISDTNPGSILVAVGM